MTTLALSTFFLPSSPWALATAIWLFDSITKLITSWSLTLRSSRRSLKVPPSSFWELVWDTKNVTFYFFPPKKLQVILKSNILNLWLIFGTTRVAVNILNFLPDSCIRQGCRHPDLQLTQLMFEVVTHGFGVFSNLKWSYIFRWKIRKVKFNMTKLEVTKSELNHNLKTLF